jgi:hypothetical protein
MKRFPSQLKNSAENDPLCPKPTILHKDCYKGDNLMQQRSSTNETILNRIREGMNVYDLSGEKVGVVREVYFGTGAGFAATPQTAHNPDMGTEADNPIYAVLTNLFGDADDVPDTLRNRMFHDGFIRINTDGIFASDRYALTEQISEALGDDVQLTVNYDELVKS